MRRRLACLPIHICALIALCSSCSFLEPREDPTRFFVLSPSAADALDSPADAALVIALGPIDLPEYLLRSEIVRRAGPNELVPSPVNRWAEPIDDAVLRVLNIDLTRLLPRSSIHSFPFADLADPFVQVEIAVATFEADLEGTARLEGIWRLRGARGDRADAHTFQLQRAVEGSGTQSLVAAMSALLGDLAREIAAELYPGESKTAEAQ
jgi:uncharacterized lipoprotein YmbA